MKYSVVLACVAALTLVACGRGEDAPATEAAAGAPADAQAGSAPEAPAAAPVDFDLSDVPVSTAPLGTFPYIGVPQGYTVRDEKTLDLAAFPIWTGAAFQIVEGKVRMASSSTPDDKTYSRLEFRRGVENSVKALGGVQVTSSEAPNPVINDLPATLRSDMSLGLGPIYGTPIDTYVVRRADKILWIQLVADGSHATWAVVEAPVAPPAG